MTLGLQGSQHQWLTATELLSLPNRFIDKKCPKNIFKKPIHTVTCLWKLLLRQTLYNSYSVHIHKHAAKVRKLVSFFLVFTF